MKTSISILLACLALFATNKNGFGSAFPFFAKPPIQGEAKAPKYQLLYPTPIIPLSKTGKPNPSPGPAPQLNEEQQKCIQLFHDTGTGSCLQDLGNSYQTQRMSVSRPCCDAIDDLDDHCKSVVHFQNFFFQKAVQQHCSSKGNAKVVEQEKFSFFGFGSSPAAPEPEPEHGVESPFGAKDGAGSSKVVGQEKISLFGFNFGSSAAEPGPGVESPTEAKSGPKDGGSNAKVGQEKISVFGFGSSAAEPEPGLGSPTGAKARSTSWF